MKHGDPTAMTTEQLALCTAQATALALDAARLVLRNPDHEFFRSMLTDLLDGIDAFKDELEARAVTGAEAFLSGEP